MKSNEHPLPRIVFWTSALFLVFMLGMASGRYYWAPSKILAAAELGWREVKAVTEQPWYYFDLEPPYPAPVTNSPGAYPGINLVTRVAADRELAAEIIDMDGRVLHRWEVDWFKNWPDADHLPERFQPTGKMESHIHGAIVMPNGDLIFNYEHQGLIRLDLNSEVVWRLPYQTHHSVHLHDDGNLWVSGQRVRTEPNPIFPDRLTPYDEYTVLEVSPDGEILNEWLISDLLIQNDLDGLYYLGSERDHSQLLGDVMHLNDVEPFPSAMEPGFFEPDDVMVSLRNTNAVIVFNRQTETIKTVCMGYFVYQHDPDFIDGNTITVYDNNHRTNKDGHRQSSRIIRLTMPGKEIEVVYEGMDDQPFYSSIMGKHQWLPNGNLLITESMSGRAFELDSNKEIVWEYHNLIGEGEAGLLEEVQRLPLEFTSLFQDHPITP